MARKIIEYILSIDLAYDLDLESKPFANQVSEYFINQIHVDGQFYTNGEFTTKGNEIRLLSWIPISSQIFDTGVIAVDGKKMGILWAEDHD